jgi:hypothetical protein
MQADPGLGTEAYGGNGFVALPRTPTDALDQQFGIRFCRTQTGASLRANCGCRFHPKHSSKNPPRSPERVCCLRRNSTHVRSSKVASRC